MELQLLQHALHNDVSDSFTVSTERSLEVERITIIRKQLQQLLKKGGPDVRDYKTLDQVMLYLYKSFGQGLITQQEIESLKALFDNEFLAETIHGYGYRKPMGYAGDFLMIDKIYTYHKSKHPHFTKWDKYFHNNAATEAVRNRKEYFKKQMLQKLKGQQTALNLLDVASGPDVTYTSCIKKLSQEN